MNIAKDRFGALCFALPCLILWAVEW